MTLRKSLLAALAMAFAAAAVAADKPASPDTAPVARRVDVVDHAFGLTLPDPYRWMEGENNAEFDAWLKAHAGATRGKLDAMPALATWRERLGKVAGATAGYRSRVQVGDKLFFLRIEAGKEGVLSVREANGRERVIYDPNTEKGATISNFSVSPDGRLTTINVGRGGNEIGDIELREVATGKRLADKLEPVWSEFNPSWLADGSGFAYTRMREVKPDDADPLQGMAAYLHRLGTPQSADLLLAKADGAAPLHITPESFPSVGFDASSRWAGLAIGGARASFRLCVAPALDASKGTAKWDCLVDFGDEIQGSAVHGDTLYLLQGGAKHPNRRLLALDLSRPNASLAQAREVVAERAGIVLENVNAARDALYLKSLRGGPSGVETLDYRSGKLGEVALPYSGSVSVTTDPALDGALLTITGWTRPVAAFHHQAGTPLRDLKLANASPADYSGLVADEIEATSADGTRVPLTVIHRRDLKLDGHARVLIEGYGGYGISITPGFSAFHLEWARAGHVEALCHVRGGGELGEAWRLGGSGMNKQRGVEDFIACAKELQTRGYGTAARTAGWGTSMGGILAGGAYTTPNDAFGAMLISVGELNPTRLLAAKNGANQFAEVGDPRTEAGLKQLVAMDPVLRVKPGASYPPLILQVGLTDQRVAPWHSGKFAATVMAASKDTPVWIYSEDAAGHFATNASTGATKFADLYSLLEALLK